MYVGQEYQFSVAVKSDEPLGNPRVTMFFKYEVDDGKGNITPSSGNGYQSVRLINREDIGNGWIRYFNTYTIAETCTTSSGQANVYSPDCSVDFRGGSANVTFTADDFIIEPAYPEQVSAESNLLAYDTFDSGVDNMKEYYATITVQTSGGIANSGYISAVPSNGNGGITFGSKLPIVPGAVYRISWYAKANDEAAAGKYLAGYFDFSGMKNEVGTSAFSSTQSTSYVRNYTKLAMSNETGDITTLTADWQYFECIFKPNNWLYGAHSELPATFYTRLFDDLSGQGTGTNAGFSMDEFKVEKLETPFNGTFNLPFATLGMWNGLQSNSNMSDTWMKGENTQVEENGGDNPYITVTQTANSDGAEDLESRGIMQYISRAAGSNYSLSFRARAREEGHTLVPYVKTLNADNTENTVS